jgi:hypothetical protein
MKVILSPYMNGSTFATGNGYYWDSKSFYFRYILHKELLLLIDEQLKNKLGYRIERKINESLASDSNEIERCLLTKLKR